MANAQSSQAPESEQLGQAPSTSLWRNRDYLLLWGGQTISSIGGGISQIAFPLLALLITHSPAQAGLLGALRSLCYSVLVLPVGALADRWNRKTVMIVCDSGRALALASILIAAALGHLTLLQLYLVTLIIGPLEVFFDIAEVASLPQVVAKDQLPAAMGNTQATFGATSLFGPPLAARSSQSAPRYRSWQTQSRSRPASVHYCSYARRFRNSATHRSDNCWRRLAKGCVGSGVSD